MCLLKRTFCIYFRCITMSDVSMAMIQSTAFHEMLAMQTCSVCALWGHLKQSIDFEWLVFFTCNFTPRSFISAGLTFQPKMGHDGFTVGNQSDRILLYRQPQQVRTLFGPLLLGYQLISYERRRCPITVKPVDFINELMNSLMEICFILRFKNPLLNSN